MTPLKLLLVSPEPPPYGGIGHWTLLLKAWLQGRPELSLRHVNIAPRWREIDGLSFLKRFVSGGVQGLRDVWRTLFILVRFRPHVLHLTTSGSLAGLRDLISLSLARVLRTRSVYHVRIGRLAQLVGSTTWEWWWFQWTMRLADKVVVLDAATEEVLKSVLPVEKVRRFPNGIDLRALAAGPVLSALRSPSFVLPREWSRWPWSRGDEERASLCHRGWRARQSHSVSLGCGNHPSA